jgi:hypothetical protein
MYTDAGRSLGALRGPQGLGFVCSSQILPLVSDVLWVGTCKQERQCTYNITLRRVRVTVVAVEKQ